MHILTCFAGGTERKVLKNFEDIVRAGLPEKKLSEHYACPLVANDIVLNKYVTFCQERIQVTMQ